MGSFIIKAHLKHATHLESLVEVKHFSAKMQLDAKRSKQDTGCQWFLEIWFDISVVKEEKLL